MAVFKICLVILVAKFTIGKQFDDFIRNKKNMELVEKYHNKDDIRTIDQLDEMIWKAGTQISLRTLKNYLERIEVRWLHIVFYNTLIIVML